MSWNPSVMPTQQAEDQVTASLCGPGESTFLKCLDDRI